MKSDYGECMEWIIIFIINWILFFVLIEWRLLKKTLWCGVFAMLLQLMVDTQAISHNLYEIRNKNIDLFGSSAFFVFGPVLVIGTLYSQYHPKKWWLRVIHVIIVSSLYSLEEYFINKSGQLVYINWHLFDSIVVNISAMIILSWFTAVVLDKERSIA